MDKGCVIHTAAMSPSVIQPRSTLRTVELLWSTSGDRTPLKTTMPKEDSRAIWLRTSRAGPPTSKKKPTISAVTLRLFEDPMQLGATARLRYYARLRTILLNTGGRASNCGMRLISSCPHFRVAVDSFAVSFSNRACFSYLQTLFSLRHLLLFEFPSTVGFAKALPTTLFRDEPSRDES